MSDPERIASPRVFNIGHAAASNVPLHIARYRVGHIPLPGYRRLHRSDRSLRFFQAPVLFLCARLSHPICRRNQHRVACLEILGEPGCPGFGYSRVCRDADALLPPVSIGGRKATTGSWIPPFARRTPQSTVASPMALEQPRDGTGCWTPLGPARGFPRPCRRSG